MVEPITIDVIQKHQENDRRWRERRHMQWTSNYDLHRDTVIINRLTQRQSVNVPYMKSKSSPPEPRAATAPAPPGAR